MPEVKISELPAIVTIASDDVLPVVDVSDQATKKITVKQIQEANVAASPTFAGLTLPSTGAISFGATASITGGTAGSWSQLILKTDTYLFGVSSAVQIPFIAGKLVGDGWARFTIEGTGMFSWGPGNGAGDIDFYRPAAGELHVVAAGAATPIPSILAVRPCWTGAVDVGQTTTTALLYNYFGATGKGYLAISAKRNTDYNIEALAVGDGSLLPIVFKSGGVESFRIKTDATLEIPKNTAWAFATSNIFVVNNSLQLQRKSDDVNAFEFKFLKTRGTGAAATWDVIGDINFNFYNSASAEKVGALIRAQITDAASTTEDARLRFYTIVAGSAVEGLRLETGTLYVFGDATVGVAATIGLTNASNLAANSTGVGTIKFKGATSRDSTGFIKIYIGTTAYYIPVFSAITG